MTPDPTPARLALAAKRRALTRPGIGGVIKAAREQAGLSQADLAQKLGVIKAAREQAGLTQDQLARKLGVTRQTVGSWERGKTPPSWRHATKLSDLLAVSLTVSPLPNNEGVLR